MEKAARIVFIVLIAELVIGGGGRLTSIGPVSLRMVLFAAAMILTAIYFLRGRQLPKTFTIFFVGFVSSLVLALIIGISSGAETRLWVEDIKPLSYVLILLFFVFVSEDTSAMRHVPGIITAGALLMAISFFIVLILIHSGAMPFLSFYDRVIGTGEFFFRAETTFFYKGFIYLCIALIFIFFIHNRFRTVTMIVLCAAILLTFTRGFVFALAVTYLFYALFERKHVPLVIGGAALLAILFFSKPVIYQLSSQLHELKGLTEDVPKDKLLGNRDESDEGRIQQAKEVFTAVTPLTAIVGHGFGNGVASRPVHMEVSYLEIFHKQGIVGLAVWSYLFYLLMRSYTSSSRSALAKSYYFSACFVFFQSMTNQFINNPIGLSFALLALTYLYSDRPEKVASPQKKRNPFRHQKGDEISVTTF